MSLFSPHYQFLPKCRQINFAAEVTNMASALSVCFSQPHQSFLHWRRDSESSEWFLWRWNKYSIITVCAKNESNYSPVGGKHSISRIIRFFPLGSQKVQPGGNPRDIGQPPAVQSPTGTSFAGNPAQVETWQSSQRASNQATHQALTPLNCGKS